MPSEIDDLHSSAAAAGAIMRRLSSPRGVLEQIESGEWDADLTARSAAGNATALLHAAAEHARYAREALGVLHTEGSWSTGGPRDLAARAAQTRLPFNRKERYFTGTVFPMVVASDGFAHLGRLLGLCGLAGVAVEPGLNALQDLQFFTEYSFRESIFTAADRRRFTEPPPGGDTPDIVLCGPDWLLAIEAKMYDQPTAVSLNTQLSRQWAFVSYWADTFEIGRDRVAHVALLPAALGRRLGDLVRPTVTWEALADAYRDVAPRYWMGQLDYANSAGLAADASAQFGANSHGRRTGQELLDGHRYPGPGDLSDLDPRAAFDYMGRRGGLDGQLVAADIATGRWHSQSYEVRQGDAPNANWFSIADFLDRVETAGT